MRTFVHVQERANAMSSTVTIVKTFVVKRHARENVENAARHAVWKSSESQIDVTLIVFIYIYFFVIVVMSLFTFFIIKTTTTTTTVILTCNTRV